MSQAGLMSEYDLYGSLLLRDHPDRVVLRPSANLKISTEQFTGGATLPLWNRRFRFVSNHQHLQ